MYRKPKEQMEREAMAIYALVPWGKENAISREKLVKYTGLTDREVRDRIKLLNTMPCTRRFCHPADIRDIGSLVTQQKYRRVFQKAITGLQRNCSIPGICVGSTAALQGKKSNM